MRFLKKLLFGVFLCSSLLFVFLGGAILLSDIGLLQREEPAVAQQPQTAVPTAAADDEAPTNWDLVNIPDSTYFIQRLDQNLGEICSLIYTGIAAFDEEIILPEPIPEKTLGDIMWLINYDCPELFQISGDYSYYVRENEPALVISLKPTYIMTLAEYNSALQQVQDTIHAWLRGAPDDELAIERLLYENIISTCSYEEDGTFSGTVYGALILGKARCEGYAKAMCMALRMAGMESLILTGEARTSASNEEERVEKHAWNVVRVNGSYCQLDPTWDDPDGAISYNTCYAYFNLTDEEMYRSRSVDEIYQQWDLPVSTNDTLSYHAQNNSYIAMEEELGEAITALLEEAYQNERNYCMGKFQTNLQLSAFSENLDTWISNWYRSKKFTKGSYHWITYADSCVFTIFNLYYE